MLGALVLLHGSDKNNSNRSPFQLRKFKSGVALSAETANLYFFLLQYQPAINMGLGRIAYIGV